MSKKDVVYYAGLFAGMIVGGVGARMVGLPGIVQLVAGLVVGVGLGFLAERTLAGGHDD